MTRDERLAALEKKAQRLRERAADVAKKKRRILRAEEKQYRADQTRRKIIWGAAFLSVSATTTNPSFDAIFNAVLSKISPKDIEFLQALASKEEAYAGDAEKTQKEKPIATATSAETNVWEAAKAKAQEHTSG